MPRREANRQTSSLFQSPTSSRSTTPTSTSEPLLTAAVGQQLESDYRIYDLPSDDSCASTSSRKSTPSQRDTEVVVNKALVARIEALEAENQSLKKQLKEATTKPQYFRIQHIQGRDKLVRFYTGFVSYVVFLAFFEFLGPVVHHLNYWGSKEGPRQRNRAHKWDPENQLFLTLVKLRLNLRHTDLALRFGLSESAVSRYITTWICFLYHHLKEINWLPTEEQVAGNRPHAFKENIPKLMQLLMEVRFSWRPHLTSTCSPLRGANISTTIPESF